MTRLNVKVGNVSLKSPLILASGTCNFGHELSEYYDLSILGGLSSKGLTIRPRAGNEGVRVAETEAGMLNSVGLQNPGVDEVIAVELPNMKKFFHKPVMANVSGFSIEEYSRTCELLDAQQQVGWLEVNISCPNVHGGGMSFGTDPKAAAEVTRAVKAVTKKPIIVKLSPNITDIASIAKACEAEGADGISLINTLSGMRINIAKRAPILKNVTGGYSGPAIFPVALRCVWQVYNAVKIPLVGMGGITTAADVIEMMLAGATAVQVGAANLVDPFACKKIIEDLPKEMEKYRINNLSDIIGGAH